MTTTRKPAEADTEATDAPAEVERPKVETATDVAEDVRLELLKVMRGALRVSHAPGDYVDVPTAKQAADVYVSLFGGAA